MNKHPQDVSGNFRLGGTSLSDANQFVVWGDADDLPDQEGGAGGDAGDFSPDGPFDMPILVAGPGLGGENVFTGDIPILVAGEGFGGGGTGASGGNIGSGDVFTGTVLVAGSRAAATNVSSTSRALPGAADASSASSAVGGEEEKEIDREWRGREVEREVERERERGRETETERDRHRERGGNSLLRVCIHSRKQL